jgi:ubiquinone/menaquinone biosynthesis C-methylase UbiE
VSLASSKTYWDDMAALDPYWAILTEAGTKHGGWKLEEFLATGEVEIDEALAVGARFGLPAQMDRALDFGCGVGRLSRAMASRFGSVVGIDISTEMLRQASALNHCPNCSFTTINSDVLPFGDDTFDFVYTAIVLQHVTSRKLISAYLRQFARVLRRRGLLVMQLPSYIPFRRRVQARRRLYAWLRAACVPEKFIYQNLRLHPIPMNFMPEQKVLDVLTTAGCRVVRVVADRRAGPHITSRTYYATK